MAEARAVVSARAVRSVDVLLVEECVLAARTEQLPPPRPALDDSPFSEIEEAEIEPMQSSWTWRSVISVKRTLALAVLTAAIYVGATAWNPATPTITDTPVTDVKAAPAKAAGGQARQGLTHRQSTAPGGPLRRPMWPETPVRPVTCDRADCVTSTDVSRADVQPDVSRQTCCWSHCRPSSPHRR